MITRFSSLALVRQLKNDMHANCKLQRVVLDFKTHQSVLPSPSSLLLKSTKAKVTCPGLIFEVYAYMVLGYPRLCSFGPGW